MHYFGTTYVSLTCECRGHEVGEVPCSNKPGNHGAGLALCMRRFSISAKTCKLASASSAKACKLAFQIPARATVRIPVPWRTCEKCGSLQKLGFQKLSILDAVEVSVDQPPWSLARSP